MSENTWPIQDAKNKFTNLVDKAQKNGPQIVTKNGKNAVVVLAFEEYKKLSQPNKNLLAFFQESPLAKNNLDISRNRDLPRKIEL